MSDSNGMPPYIAEIARKFGDKGVRPEEFIPVSTWFSYGSNLCRLDFERKMRENGSQLSLVQARPASLMKWERRLDNKSRRRGLAYSVNNGRETSLVEGIVHDVPTSDLPAFLHFEGVLDGNNLLRSDEVRSYDVERVRAQLLSDDDSQGCFVLVGRLTLGDERARLMQARAYRDDLINYVQTAINGAIDFHLDVSGFEKDLEWVRGLT